MSKLSTTMSVHTATPHINTHTRTIHTNVHGQLTTKSYDIIYISVIEYIAFLRTNECHINHTKRTNSEMFVAD